jgi:hypothetical protein
MPKKRKLNSKNHKYMTQAKKDGPVIKERKLLCEVVPTNIKTGKKSENTRIPVYGIWYEDETGNTDKDN